VLVEFSGDDVYRGENGLLSGGVDFFGVGRGGMMTVVELFVVLVLSSILISSRAGASS
jgi:hypothetical protein